MSKDMIYAGIGSRSTPKELLDIMSLFSEKASKENALLRSGGAIGADRAFESNANRKEIFLANDALEWSFEEVKKHMPVDRSGYDNWKPYIKKLLARNMMQVLGSDKKSLVDFVICWTPSLEYSDSSSGGTGYAIRCALHYSIPVWNMFDDNVKEKVINYINNEDSIAIFKG